MSKHVTEAVDDPRLAVDVVWVPELGAEERHVAEAAGLMQDPRVRHWWDPDRSVGWAVTRVLGLAVDRPAWDIYLLYGPDASWTDGGPGEPVHWEHQLDGVTEGPVLDAGRFADEVRAALAAQHPNEGDDDGS